MTAPTDRPMLFSGPMVRAILAGRKTETRRVVKPRGRCSLFDGSWADSYVLDPGNASWRAREIPSQPVDSIWVRETFWIATRYSYGSTPGGYDLSPPPLARRRGDPIHFAAGGDPFNQPNRHYPTGLLGGFSAPDPYAVWAKTPSIHMPRWASRITLMVEDVRVERLQDIDEAGAIAEGVEPPAAEREDHDWSICPSCGGTGLHGALGQNLGYMEVDCSDCTTSRSRFRHLWNSIHDPAAWDANPWVSVTRFRTVLANIDSLSSVGAAA